MSHAPMTQPARTQKGLIIAAPFTGSGKTTVTLGLLRALSERGLKVAPAKIGPDYIDPQFHEAACGHPSVNLDGWAMRPALLSTLISEVSAKADITIAEGVMGLFDGGAHPGHIGRGATSDIASFTGWPVVLIVDCARIGQSVAPLIKGFQNFDPTITVAGVILNGIASQRHGNMMRTALNEADITCFGMIPRQQNVTLPSRHLGLVQAEEQQQLDAILNRLCELITTNIALDAITAIATPHTTENPSSLSRLKPLGQKIAIAQDQAFRFTYQHLLSHWQNSGAQILPFSPLADEAPSKDADTIYLPGGYPELHAGKLGQAQTFKTALRNAAENGIQIFAECGGYMVLGDGIIDADGQRHEMVGLLRLETSFHKRRLHLGYRKITAATDFAAGPQGATFRAHEFHHATIVSEEGNPLFTSRDDGTSYGLTAGSVAGSFMHLIDMDES